MASLSRKIKRTQLKRERLMNRHASPSLGRSGLRARALGAGIGGALVLLSAPAYAGDGFTQTVDGKTTTFNQTADKVFNKVGSYNIGVDELHNYIQPSASSVFVQRVMGEDPSSILGQLSANGQVWIMNPSGVMIGSEARINTAGFMASSLVMGEDDFFAGRYDLSQEGEGGYVINKGDITVNNGGYAILAGASVVNDGHITAPDGEVVLSAGRRMSFDMNGDGLINFNVDEKTAATIVGPDGTDLTSAVLNSGDISAARVEMTAKARRDIFDAVVNNTGVVEAASVETGEGGVIRLVGGDEGDVVNTGTLDASGTTGGDVALSGERVGQLGDVHADASAGDGGNINLTAADVVALGADSTTTANAGLEGDGGNVVTKSLNMALFRNGATIEAKG
ncbi:MAG: filamentous hemagglutinin N-terminal domain-containing protein, partial [Deltaproteobacteria bacterium]|nr:filamentous hemagglutinin N-terminal domain-containing protein [Deltaproteobacteria bacterium]